MSKSPNLLLPALGGTALVLGVAFGVAGRNYNADLVGSYAERVERLTATASQQAEKTAAQTERAEALATQLAALEAQPTQANLTAPAPMLEATYGLGRAAYAEEIAAWDVDILPDGRGLPSGSGDVWTGEETFITHCAACHGDFAEGVDNWPPLAGGFDTLGDEDPAKTVGSYWPYLSTVWDYVHRSMPFGNAGTLTDDETYAIVAYILYSNDLVDNDFVLSDQTFADVEMYNPEGFVIDDRAEREYSAWRAEPCMENCKDSVEITMRAIFLDVTPEDGSESQMNDASVDDTPTFGSDDAGGHAVSPELIAHGEKVFRRCSACHEVGAGAKSGVGPHLNGLLGRTFASVDGFRYSIGFVTAGEEGQVWTDENLAAFLTRPKDFIAGTNMAFAGLRSPEDIAAVSAYLKSLAAEQ